MTNEAAHLNQSTGIGSIQFEKSSFLQFLFLRKIEEKLNSRHCFLFLLWFDGYLHSASGTQSELLGRILLSFLSYFYIIGDSV